MSKSRFYFCVVIGCAAIFFLIAYLYERPPLFYYTNVVHWQKLPVRLIRPAFRHAVGRNLPPKADGLQAIFLGGREPSIFVRFKTDSDGIAYLCKIFEKNGTWETFDEDRLRFMNTNNVCVFPTLELVQKKVGVILFDQHSVKSGRTLTGCFDVQKGPDYSVFIDDCDNMIYIAVTNR